MTMQSGRYASLLCLMLVASCHKTAAADAAEQAQISRAMVKVEADQARSDLATAIKSARAIADTETLQRKASPGN